MKYLVLWAAAAVLVALFWGAFSGTVKVNAIALLLAAGVLLAFPLIEEHLSPEQRAELTQRQRLQQLIEAEIRKEGAK